jgi:hypothetical protein
MRTVTRFYRGHRIRAVQFGSTWHTVVQGPTGSIIKGIEAATLLHAMAQAEWFIEARLRFQPPTRQAKGRLNPISPCFGFAALYEQPQLDLAPATGRTPERQRVQWRDDQA